MKGKHLRKNLRIPERKDYETEIRLLKNENALLRKGMSAAAEEVQRLRIVCELNGVNHERAE